MACNATDHDYSIPCTCSDDRCEECGAPPEKQDPYWADGTDFHRNHCPHCGAYHRPPRREYPYPEDFSHTDEDISF